MKKIFSFLVFALIAVLSTTNCFAQKTTSPSGNVSKQQTQAVNTGTTDNSKLTSKEIATKVTDWMRTNVGINDAQAGRVNVATSGLIEKVRSIQQSGGDAADKKAAMREAMNLYNAQLKSLFTAEQMTTYNSKKSELKSQYKEFKDAEASSAE